MRVIFYNQSVTPTKLLGTFELPLGAIPQIGDEVNLPTERHGFEGKVTARWIEICDGGHTIQVFLEVDDD